jgi:flagellar motility protein MotE (MotC chaperone)
VADEEKTTAEPTPPEEKSTPKKKSALVSYALMGGAVLAVVVVAALVTLMLLKDSRPPEASSESASVKAIDSLAAAPTEAGDHLPDSLMSDSASPQALDKIMASLEFLDYKPTTVEVATEEEKMSAKDSVEAVNWLEHEKARLAEREKTINARQAELEALDRNVTKKLLTLEQAESARVIELAKLYDGMDTRAVANLMASLDDSTIVAILPRMKTKNASAVLEQFPPKRAALLSKRLITIADK